MDIVDRAFCESTPEGVERDLAALWRQLAAAGPGIARALMANLVVLRPAADPDASDDRTGNDDSIEAVVALHPSRTIVIEHEQRGQAPPAPSAARVGISVFGSASARYGVERILIRSGGADVSLASIVRRFVHGDRPTSLWWPGDLSQHPLDDGLVDFARQLLYDSRDWRDVRAGLRIVSALAQAQRVDLADLNWRRLDSLRRALSHAAAGTHLDEPPRISITCRGGEDALGWLVAGWLTARLELERASWPDVVVSPSDEEILTLTIDAGSKRLTAAMNEHRVLVSCPESAPVMVAAPREQPAEAMAAELRMLSRDAALTETVLALGRMLV